MNTNSGHDIDPALALAEIDRITHRARTGARWVGWFYLTMGIGVGTVNVLAEVAAISSAVGVLALLALGLALGLYAARQRVIGPTGTRTIGVTTVAFIAVVAFTVLLNRTVIPNDSGWSLMIGMLPVVPCLLGAWWGFRR